jgi:hypothetical protein
MKYGRDFYINDDFVYNFSGFSVRKANYIIKMDNFPNPSKCKLFKTKSAAIRFFKSIKGWVKVYEKYNDKWYETYYEPCNDRFCAEFGADTKIEE